MTARPSAREKLLDASFDVIRRKGYAGTTVDDLCEAAGVTKGAFFHHFKSKTALGVAVADHWSSTTSQMFASMDYHKHEAALDRVLGYIDFRTEILSGPIEAFTCVVGTMVQETWESAPDIRNACGNSIFGHAETLEADIAQAMSDHGLTDAGFTPRSLARHTQAVLQGGFILAKADGGPAMAIESARHLRRYIELLFSRSKDRGDA